MARIDDDVRTERQFRLLAEAVPLPVWAAGPDGRIDYTNARWRDDSGMSAEESAGHGWLRAVHPDDLAGLRAHWSRSLEAGEPFEAEVRLRRADGDYRWFLMRAEPVVDDEGRVARWFGTSTDINDCKREHDAAMRDGADRLRMAAEAARLGHWEWDIPADRIAWSEGLVAIAGHGPGDFGATLDDLLRQVHPDDRARVRASIERGVAEGTPYEEEFRIARGDRSYRWAFSRGQAYYDRAGRPARMVGVDVDVTARREAQEQWRQSEARFRASVDMLLDCFAIYTAVRDEAGQIVDFRIEHVNEPACLSHRLTRDDLHGRRLLEVLPGHRTSGLFERYRRVVEADEPLSLDDVAYRDEDNRPRLITVRAARLDDGLVCIWRDVTDDRAAAEALRAGEERFRLAALASNGLIYDWDPAAGRVDYFGQMQPITGYRPDEAEPIEGWWFERIHPDDLASVRTAVEQAFRGGAHRLALDYRIRHRDGRWVDIEDNVLFLRDERGAVVRGIGCSFDVSERRRVERVLVESQHLAARIAEVCPVILCVFDLAEGRPIFLNREMTESLGYPREELAARTPGGPESLMHPDDATRFAAHMAHVLALGDGETADFEFRMRHADGSWRWFYARDAVFRRDDAGVVAQVLSAAVDVTTRREAEESLRRSEAEYRSLFEAAGVGNAETDLTTGRFVRANRTFCELVGYAADELNGMTFLDLTHPDDRARNLEALDPFIREQRPRFEIEKRYICKDGRIVWVHLTGTLIRDAAGRAVRLLGSAHDVTERRLAEQRVRESELLFRATFDNAAVGIAHVAPDGRWLRVNEVLCDIVGYSREEMLATTFQAITHPDDLPLDLERAGGLLEGVASTYGVEKRYVHKDGRPVWVHLTVSLIRDAEGRPDFFISVVQDITARRQVEDEVRRLNAELDASLRRLRTILDTAPVGINVALDPECRVIQGNPALMAMLGMERGSNVSKSAADAHTLPYRIYKEGAEAPPETLPMQRSAATGLAVDDDLYEIERGDGSRIQVLVRAQPVRDEQGRVAGAVGVVVDVTAMRQAEQALREADRRKNEFLAVLAHELRNPLSAIRNAVALLQAEGPADPERAWGVEVIDRQGRQLTRLVDDLLDVSRIARGKIVLRRRRVDLREVVANAVEAVGPMLEQKRQELAVVLPPGPIPVDGDPTRLEQVLINLLTNATKYTDLGGRVELRAACEGDEAIVRVRDTGIGIPPDELRKIFDLFAQVDPSHERAQGGLGIGLTLVQNLVGLHGGTVSASSAGPGQGSEFVVRLPRLGSDPVDAPGAPAPAAPARPATAAPARRRVLVVDDNVDAARGLSRLLKLQGHEVTTAFDGPAAVTLARDARPEFALLDIGMPGMDGYELVRSLRTLDACRGTTFIALSGYAQDHDREQARAAGFDHHLVKPVDLDALDALLSGVPESGPR